MQARKVLFTALTVIIVFGLLALAGKLILFFSFALGEDTTTIITIEDPVLHLHHNQQKDLEFSTKVITNPFCKATCTASFTDISSNTTVQKQTYKLSSGKTVRELISIKAPEKGKGQVMYRYTVSCQSEKTTACHTSEQPSLQEALITVSYAASQQNKERLAQSKAAVEAHFLKRSEAKEILEATRNTATTLDISLPLDQFLQEVRLLEKEFGQLHLFSTYQHEFNEEAYEKIEALLQEDEQKVDDLLARIQKREETIESIRSDYNTLGERTGNLTNLATVITGQHIMNTTFFEDILAFQASLLHLQNDTHQRTSLVDKQKLLKNAEVLSHDLIHRINLHQAEVSIQKSIESDVHRQVLCELAQACTPYPNINERIAETPNLQQSCEEEDVTKNVILNTNHSMRFAFSSAFYPEDTTFWQSIIYNITQTSNNVKATFKENISGDIPPTVAHALQPFAGVHIPFFFAGNKTPAIVSMLAVNAPSCSNQVVPKSNSSFFFSPILPTTPKQGSEKTIKDIAPQCCLFHHCTACTTNTTNYPIILLHGHAVSKEVGVEISLEGFGPLQTQLEDLGYVSAGSTLHYLGTDLPKDSWSSLPLPISLRATYYADTFHDGDDITIVPSKSENIETYATRLSEIITSVKEVTGKEKVHLVSFSMGGLVSRRYLQLFGEEDVASLIMIGTPNKGIEGTIADACPITGETRECRDLNKDSLFMNKLNRGNTPKIPTTNIIGAGCLMEGKQGDGAVLKDNALLDGVQNHVINGTCTSTIMPLHLELINIEKYPEVFNIIRNHFSQ